MASGAEWLLAQIGDVLVSTTTVDVGAKWFRTHYGQMTALAGVVVLPMLLASTLQAVVRQNPGQLVRTFLVQLPLALLLAAVAIQVVILSLSATDAMSDAVAGGSGADVQSLLSGVTTGLVAAAGDPTIASFVLLLVALLVAVAAFVLWLELLIRAAAVYVAVLFLPLALAALVWPAVSHWCRRLIETLAALILSKFVIVATLSLAAGAVSSGTAGTGAHGAGFSAVLAGGALLVMATFVPFAILRLIPAVEAGAVAQLDGLRARGTAAMTRLPRSAASHALHEGLGALGDARLLAQTPAGRAAAGGTTSGAGPEGAGSAGTEGVDLGEGDPGSRRRFDELVGQGVTPAPKGPRPVLGPGPAPAGEGRNAGDGGKGEAAEAAEATQAHSTAEAAPVPRAQPYAWHPAPTGPATPEDSVEVAGRPAGPQSDREGRSRRDALLHGRRRSRSADLLVAAGVAAGRRRWPRRWPGRRRGVSADGGSHYRFGPRERGGALAGWRAGQIVTVAVGLVFGVLVLRWEPNAAGAAAAVAILVLYGALATVPVSGRTGDEWLPVAVSWGARRAGRAGGRHMGALRGVRLLRSGWRDMGVVHDHSARTLTAVLALRGGGFALLGADDQDRRVGAWASVLSSLAREGSPVHRVQWASSSFPDDGQGVRSYLATEAAPGAASACTASYDALLSDMDSHTCAHDVLLAVQVRLTRSVEVGCATLAREVGSLVRLLSDADVEVESLLTADDLAHRLLRTYEANPPSAGPARSLGDPWPMAMEESWSTLRVDGMYHATFWVAEWPARRGAQRLPGSPAHQLGPLDLVGRDGASASRRRRPQGGGVAHGGPGRRRAPPPRRVRLDRPARPRVRGPGPSRGGVGRGACLLPVLGLRHRLGAQRGGTGRRLRRRATRGRAEPPRTPPPLRRPGHGLHLHPAALPRVALSGASTMTRWLHAPGPDPRAGAAPPRPRSRAT